MLEIIGACKTFDPGTINERKVLADLSLSLEPGEFATLIGSNGAGKSTLLNAISGSFLLDAGKILLGGEDITFMKEHKRSLNIGRLFQDPAKGTAPGLTVAENLALSQGRKTLHAFSPGVRKTDQKTFRDQLARFGMGLEDRMKTKVGLLSGGQRQALALLMSTLSQPSLLLLDEHTAALDPAAAVAVMNITKEIIRERKLTTLMVTHNIQSALTDGDRVLMMEGGSIILDLKGEARGSMTVTGLMDLYARTSHKELDNDRMLLN